MGFHDRMPARQTVTAICAICASECVGGVYFGFASIPDHVTFWILAGTLLIAASRVSDSLCPTCGPVDAVIRTGLVSFGLVVLCGLVLGATRLLASHSPFIAYDSLSYHLFFPARWLQAHRVSIIPTPHSHCVPPRVRESRREDLSGQDAMNILGIWDGHDAGAALLVDGRLVAAANEERFTRRKLDYLGDGGLACGAALAASLESGQRPTVPLDDLGLGPEFDDSAIHAVLARSGLAFTRIENLPDAVAELLMDCHVVLWFQGRMEYGPRALGHRSILARPDRPELRDRFNLL